MELQGNKLVLALGFSHKVEVELPKTITAKVDEKMKNVIHFSSADKQLL